MSLFWKAAPPICSTQPNFSPSVPVLVLFPVVLSPKYLSLKVDPLLDNISADGRGTYHALPTRTPCTMILFLTLLVCFSPAEGFLQRKAIAATASSCRPSSERCVSRGAETRTTVSTGDNFNNHGDSSAGSNFQKLCELLSPDQSKFLKLDATDDGVRGVYTTQQIRQGDVILTVPLDYCLRDDDIPCKLSILKFQIFCRVLYGLAYCSIQHTHHSPFYSIKYWTQ